MLWYQILLVGIWRCRPREAGANMAAINEAFASYKGRIMHIDYFCFVCKHDAYSVLKSIPNLQLTAVEILNARLGSFEVLQVVSRVFEMLLKGKTRDRPAWAKECRLCASQEE